MWALSCKHETNSCKGSFTMDMSKTHVQSGGSPTPILDGRLTTAGSGRSAGGSLLSLMKIHGFMASLAMLLFPIGVYLLRSPTSKAGFSRHWMMQSIATAMLMFTALSGLYHSLFVHRHFSSIHQWLGIVLAAAFPSQIYLGILHHRHYVVHRSRSRISYFHIWTGRSAMLLGVLNVYLGCMLGGLSYEVPGSFFVVWLLEVTLLLLLLFRSASKSEGRSGGSDLAEEDHLAMRPLADAFDIDDEEEEEEEEDEDESGARGTRDQAFKAKV